MVILVTAFRKSFPGRDIRICRSVNKCTFCEVLGTSLFDQAELERLQNEMLRLATLDLPIHVRTATKEELIVGYQHNIMEYDIEGLEKSDYLLYTLENVEIYMQGEIAKSTGGVDKFRLQLKENGFLLTYPNFRTNGEIQPFTGSERLMSAIREYSIWGDILGVHNVTQLNAIAKSADARDMVHIQESLQEKRISQIADMIAARAKCRVVLISGPSSSGKTTFAHKLNIQLRVCGLEPVNISLDDYYLPLDKMPIKKDGSYDFEELASIDYKLFNTHLEGLLSGKEVKLPRFEFGGKPAVEGKIMRLKEGQIILVEGIHALNEKISYSVRPVNKFKIYCSPLIDLNIDNYNPVSPTDTRLLRRIVRDLKFRNSTAENTMKMWKNVQEGELKNIFPYEEQSDIIFNSATIYEFSLFRIFAVPALQSVPETSPKYEEAKRLIGVLAHFAPMDDGYISATALIREFIGGSSYYK